MDGDYISRHEHEEFRRSMEAENQRLEDENIRQNHRLNALEETVKQVAAISTSVEKLALNMENMLKEQVNQGKRLETLESRDGEMWRKVVGYVVTAVVEVNTFHGHGHHLCFRGDNGPFHQFIRTEFPGAHKQPGCEFLSCNNQFLHNC